MTLNVQKQSDFDVESQEKRAKAAFDNKQYELAIELSNEVLRHAPHSVNVKKTLVGSFMMLRRPDEAYPYLIEAVRANHNDSLALKTLGVVCYAMGKYEESITCYYRVIAENGQTASVFKGLGDSLVKVNQLSDAADAYSSALALEPTWTRGILEIGLLKLREGKVDESISKIREFISIEPRHADSYIAISQCYVIKGLIRKDLSQILCAMEQILQSIVISPFNFKAYAYFFKCFRSMVEIAFSKSNSR